MSRKTLFTLLCALVLLSFVITACQPAVTPEPAKPPTTAPVEAPTKAPVEVPTTAPVVTSPPVATYETMKLEAANCDYGGEIKAIESLDEFTVKFSLCYPDPAFISKLPMMSFAIQDKEYLDANKGDSVKMSEKPNGTGPYILKEWVKGDHVTLEANPNYWGEPAKTKTLIFRWSAEATQRLLEIQAGTIDGMDNPSPDDLATVQADPNLNLVPRSSINILWLNMNNTFPPFDNLKVRQAIAMAIDKQRIVDNYFPPGAIVAETFLPPSLYPGSSDLKWYPYNVDEAKKLLAEAGFPNGFSVDISFRPTPRTYLPMPDKVAQEVKSQLAKIGVTVKINQMESTTFLDALYAGKIPLALIGGNGDYPDASNLYDWIFNNKSIKNLGIMYDDIAAELSAAGKLSDPAARQVYYEKANVLLKEHAPIVPIAHGVSATVYKKNVQNAHSSPFNKEAFQVMSNGTDQFVWMQGAEPAVTVCSDENDDETTRVCAMIYETLAFFKPGSVEMQPVLAESWSGNTEATEWTFTIRKGVKFQNGATLDANDVVATFISQWDANDPNHVGRTGTFDYFGMSFGQFLNKK